MWQDTLHQLNHLKTTAKAIALWNGDPHSMRLVNNGFNVVFFFTSKGQGRYLKFTHQAIQDQTKNDMLSALQLQHYLAEQGVHIARPIVSNQGNLVEWIDQDQLVFKASVVAEVPGNQLDFNVLTLQDYALLGQTLAEFHRASQSFQPLPNSHYKNWLSLFHENLAYLHDPAIIAEFQAIAAYFATLPQTRANFGVTHGDLRSANILFDGKQFNIIDIDEPVYHWYAADMIRPFIELAEQPYHLWQAQFAEFLAGYSKILPISTQDFLTFNWLARMKNLDVYLWASNNWHNPNSPDNTEPASVWIERWHQRVGTRLFQV